MAVKYAYVFAGTIYAFCSLALVSPNLAIASERCEASMAKGTACACKLSELHPTQMAIGKLRVIELESDGFDRLAQHVAKDGKHAMVVVGPAGVLYIVDGHHHARAMEDLNKTGETSCQIDRVVQHLPSDAASFWTEMEGLGLARLRGADGVKREGVFPPADLHDLADDPFRTLSGWIEDECDVKPAGDFADFKLGDLLRGDPKAVPPATESDRMRSVAEGLRFLAAPSNQARLAMIVGPSGVKTLGACK